MLFEPMPHTHKHSKAHSSLPVNRFLLLGILGFLIYLFSGKANFSFVLLGPPIYIAYTLKSFLSFLKGDSPLINDFVFILPVTVLYYWGISFFIERLQNEKGWIKTISLTATVLFLVFVHYLAWNNLSAYYQI